MNVPRSSLQWMALFDSLDDVQVWAKDRAGRYVWVNRAFLLSYALEVEGAEVGTIVGKTDYDFSPAFLADQFRIDDEQVLAGHRIVDRLELVGSHDAEAAWNVTNKVPLVDDAGTIIGTAGLTRRLSEPASLETARGHGLGAVLTHLRDHFHTPITNERLARLAHMSVRAFERKFQACFHVTPQKYLRKLRLRMASRALIYTKEPLAEIASSCGFSDQSHFTREFRRHFGRTPRDYREHYRSGREDAGSVPGTDAVVQENGQAGPL